MGGRDDYAVVIVGAGSAGAVVAAGLAADPDRRVLLLEAGPCHASGAAPPGVHGANCFAALSEPGRLWPGLTATRTSGQAESMYARGRGGGRASLVQETRSRL